MRKMVREYCIWKENIGGNVEPETELENRDDAERQARMVRRERHFCDMWLVKRGMELLLRDTLR